VNNQDIEGVFDGLNNVNVRRESDNLTFGKNEDGTNKVSMNSIVSPLPPQNLENFFDYSGEEHKSGQN